MGISPAASVTLLLLALVTPLPRNARAFGISLHGTVAALVGAAAFFALLGLSLRVLRFDIAAPLLGFSAPGALAAMLAAIALAAARPTRVAARHARRAAHRRGGDALAAAGGVHRAARRRLDAARRRARRPVRRGGRHGAVHHGDDRGVRRADPLGGAHPRARSSGARAQAEVQAGESREWLQVTLAAIGDGVIATDREGRVRFLNAAAQRLTGWRAAEAAGRPIDELLRLFDERNGAAAGQSRSAPACKTRAAATAQRRARAARARRQGAPGARQCRADRRRRRRHRRRGAGAARGRRAAPGRARDARGLHRARRARGAPHRGARAGERGAARAQRAAERDHHQHARPDLRQGPRRAAS